MLRDYLGVRNMLWLGDGIEGDDTDGHVDDLTRFVNRTTVVTVIEEDEHDPNHEPLQANLHRLREMSGGGRLAPARADAADALQDRARGPAAARELREFLHRQQGGAAAGVRRSARRLGGVRVAAGVSGTQDRADRLPGTDLGVGRVPLPDPAAARLTRPGGCRHAKKGGLRGRALLCSLPRIDARMSLPWLITPRRPPRPPACPGRLLRRLPSPHFLMNLALPLSAAPVRCLGRVTSLLAATACAASLAVRASAQAPTATLTVLDSFYAGNNVGEGGDGSFSKGHLIQGSDGSFYGTASGDAAYDGTVFDFTPAGTLEVVYSFSRGAGRPQDWCKARTVISTARAAEGEPTTQARSSN